MSNKNPHQRFYPGRPALDESGWRPIPGYPGYDVNEDGRVRVHHTQPAEYITDPPVPYTQELKYVYGDPVMAKVTLKVNGGNRRFYVPDLIALAFPEEPDE